MATQADLYNTEPAAAGAAEVAPPELEPEQLEGAYQRRRARRQNVVEVAAVDGRSGPGRVLLEVPLESPRNRRQRRNVPGGTESVKLSAKRKLEPRRMATGTIGMKILLGTILVTVTAVVVTLLVMLATLDATWI